MDERLEHCGREYAADHAVGEGTALANRVRAWAVAQCGSLLQAAVQEEAAARCNAGPCQRTPQRIARRGGTYRRCLTTRLGRLPLTVPRLDRSAGGSALLSVWSRDPDVALSLLLDLAAGRNSWSAGQALLAPLYTQHGEAAWIMRLAHRLLQAAERCRRGALPLQVDRLCAIPLADPLRAALPCAVCLCLEPATPGLPQAWFSVLPGPPPGAWASLFAQVRERGLLRPASVEVPTGASAAAVRLWPAARILPGPDSVPL